MKEIKAVIKPFMQEQVIDALHQIKGLPAVTISTTHGLSVEHGAHDQVVMTKLEVMVPDDQVEHLVGIIQKVAHTPARAITNLFFDPLQPATVVASNITSGAISSSGYLFVYTADGYWSASPGGPPTGWFFSVFWPKGVQAQAITAEPDVGVGANITNHSPARGPPTVWAAGVHRQAAGQHRGRGGSV